MVDDAKVIREELAALRNRIEEQMTRTEERIRDSGGAVGRSKSALARADEIIRAVELSAKSYEARETARRSSPRK